MRSIVLVIITLFANIAASAEDLRQQEDTLAAEKNKRDSLFTEAKRLAGLYRLDEAILTLEGLASADSTDIEARKELADCYFQNGNVKEAYSEYSRLSAERPDDLFLELRHVLSAFRCKDCRATVALGGMVLQKDSIPAVEIAVGDSYAGLGLVDSAMLCYGNVLRRSPAKASVVSKMAKIWLDARQYDSVTVLTEKYMSLVPDDTEINRIRGLAYYLKGDYKKSQEAFELQKELGDSTASTRMYLGLDYLMTEKMMEAHNELSASYAMDSTQVHTVIGLASAKAFFTYGDGSKVFSLLDKAEALVQPPVRVMFNIWLERGKLYFKLGDWDKAIEAYSEVYSLNPDYISALSTIGYCYEMKDDFQNALEYYEAYLKRADPATKSYKFVQSSVNFVKSKLFMEE